MDMSRDQSNSNYELNFHESYSVVESINQQPNFESISIQEGNAVQHPTTQYPYRRNLKLEQIDDLNLKKQNLQMFMNTIGQIANQPIRNDILDHCQKISIHLSRNLNRQHVIRLTRNRVEKMIKNKRIKKNWSQEDINILVWVISKYCQYHGISCLRQGICEADWNSMAQLIPGVTGKSCMFKWLSLKKSNLAQNSWVEEESLLLDQMVKNYGQNNWCIISQQLYLKNKLINKVYRCPKQCREHWNCYLNPKLKKGPWQKKQDYLLLRAVKQLNGVKKWAEIVKLFNGRTQNALKNRFTLIVQKQMKDQKNKKKCNELQLVQIYLKRYQQSFSIDEAKLKFLSEVKQQINQNQLKKKPKKTRQKRQKDINDYSQQADQYFPSDQNQKIQQKTRVKKRKLSQNYQAQIRQNIQQTIQHNQNWPCDANPYQKINYRIEQQIFESDSQNQIKRPISPQGQNLQQYHPHLNVSLSQIQQIPHNVMIGNWMRFHDYDRVSGEENLNVNHNELFIVPFSKQLFQSIKSRTLIPCSMIKTNDSVELKKVNR